MKIVHLCIDGTYTDNRTYQENLLAKYHRLLGNEVTIICSRWKQGDSGTYKYERSKPYTNIDDVNIVRLPMKGLDIRNKKIKRFKGLAHYIEQIRPDIIFIHGIAIADARVIIRYKKRYPLVKIYADNHGDFANSATTWLSKHLLHSFIWKHYATMISPYVTYFYGVSPARVDFMRQMYKLPEEKCKLLLLGADDELIQAAKKKNSRKTTRDVYHITQEDFLIVTGGKINSFRLETLNLIKAIKKINNPNIKLLIFGSVSKTIYDSFKDEIDYPGIHYVGWISSEYIYDIFEAADLVVFPGLHSVMWEQSIAQGVPGIFKKIDGFEHIDLGGNVSLLEECSELNLYTEILRILRTPGEYNKMKDAAMKTCIVFSYKRIAQQCIEQDL